MSLVRRFCVLLCAGLVGGCDSAPTSPKPQTCFSFLDSYTNGPLGGVYVHVAVREQGQSWPNVYTLLDGTTDTSGRCCFEIGWPAMAEGELSAQVAGYETLLRSFSGGVTPREFHMVPAGYLQLHVRNIPPQATDDQLRIEYPGPGSSAGVVWLEGAGVDTTLTVAAHPGDGWIRWSSWHGGVRVEATRSGIVVAPRDTARVEVLY